MLMITPAFSQNVNVNPGAGSYMTLKEAFDNINNGTHTGAITIDIIGNTTETASAVLNASGGSSSYTSILIQPSGGAPRTVSGNLVNGHLIDLNGADNITIDGLNSGGNSLTISNTGTGTSSTFRFIGDAKTNIIQHCTLQGSSTSSSSGVIFFSTGSSTGNDGNTISNCDITAAGSNHPSNGIYSLGSAAMENSGNIIHQNNISDYFSAIVASQGINLAATGNTAWTITNNRLFQTANRIFTTANIHSGIFIGVGSSYTISGNIIGYANSSGTGTTNLLGINAGSIGGSFPDSYTLAGVTLNATRYVAINCTFSANGTVSEIQNNTISGFAILTSSGASSASMPPLGIWCGIRVTNANVNIGTTAGNIIGSTTGSGSVYAATSTTGGVVVGIYCNSSNIINIQNNSIGAIDAVGTTASITAGFTGIDVEGAAGILSATNNSIGNSSSDNIRTGYTLLAGSLSNVGTLSSSTGSVSTFIGIRNTTTGSSLTVTGNTLRGWATSGTVIPVTGITNTGAITGAITINSNLFGTSSTEWMRYAVANSSALFGISNTGGSTSSILTIQTNDFSGINYSVVGTNANTYLTNSALTLSQNISSNTFTNLVVNTSGSIIFISNTSAVPSTGTQTVNNNSIITAFTKSSAGGSLTLFISNAGSVAGAIITHTGNTFSNITVTGATTIAGWADTDGGTPTKNISSNIFNNWTGGTNPITVMNLNFIGGASSFSFNTITNIAGQGAITGLNIGASGAATSLTIGGNLVANLSSTGTGGAVSGITCSNSSAGIIFTGNTIHSLSTTGSTGTTGVVNGINITGLSAPTITKNKIYNLSGNQALTTVNGINCNITGTLTIANNLIGDLRSTAAIGLNAINGINLSNTGTYNVYFNTIYLNASSSSVTTFGNSCITFSSIAASFNNRNNILVNLSTPAQEGLNVATNGFAACLRRSAGSNGVVPANYAITSDNNLYWVNPTAGTNNHLTYGEGTTTVTNPMNTLALFKTFLVNRDQLSVTEDPTFLSTTGSDVSFLHIDPDVATQVNNGAVSIGGITDDYDGDVRDVTTPDIGADEMIQAGCATVVTNANDIGEGSLRDVIDCVGQGATITFSADISGSTILLTSGEIVINKNLTLAGPGAINLALSGNNASRIFHILPGNTLTIQGMTLKDASAISNGGAVYAQGNLTLNGVVLQHNFENGAAKSLTLVSPAILQIIGAVDLKN